MGRKRRRVPYEMFLVSHYKTYLHLHPHKNLSKPARLLQIQEINPWVPKPCYVDLTETMKGLLQRL